MKCLNSVIRATSGRIIVIDNSNGKIDDELDIADEMNRVMVIRNEKNIGKPASISKYYKLINPNGWFITMDPDVIVPVNGIDKMIVSANNLLDRKFPVAVCCPAIINEPDDWDSQLESKHMNMHIWDEMFEISNGLYINTPLAGCMMLVNSMFYEFIGGFKNDKLYNNDDGYLCNLSNINNCINIIDSNIRCIHDNTENEPGYIEWKERNFYCKNDDIGYWD
jgi:hypothetical protein